MEQEQPDSTETDDEKIARALAEVSESPTAIERQIAAASALGYGGEQTQQGAAGDFSGRRVLDYTSHHRKRHRFGLGSFLGLFLLAAAGLVAFIFTDVGGSVQKAFNAVPPLAKQIAATPYPAPAINSASTVKPAPVTDSSPNREPNSSSTINSSSITNASPTTDVAPTTAAPSPTSDVAPAATSNPAPIINPSLISEPQAAAPKETTEVASTAALSVPIADVSLRNRPELMEQLVQIYRAQLANNSKDATAQNALNQLQDRSLSELQTIIAQGDDSVTVKSLAVASRLFPELADNPRYKYLISRMDYIHRQAKDESLAKANQSIPAPTAATATPTISPAPVAAAPATNSPTTKPAAKSASLPVAAAPAGAKKDTESAASLKPEIRAVSIMPGTMVDGRFVPRDGGNVFMVELSYSNFSKAFIDKSEATLVAQLSEPGDSMVLAEVPVVISADRGTKSFTMETTDVQGYTGGKFQLDFLLNDEYFTARTVRLSKP